MVNLIDTHCHIHSDDYSLEAEKVYQKAFIAGVTKLICVGTDIADSKLAAEWAMSHENCWASVGVHPHEAKHGVEGLEALLKDKNQATKIVAVGEIGLDYHYMHSPKRQQIATFEAQLQLAVKYDMPVIFHMREAPKQDQSATGQAFEDFWSVLNNYPGVRGVVHSFTDTEQNLRKALDRKLYIGINGIVTFPKSENLQKLVQQIPLTKLLLETDAPYLTPAPHRGTVNEPAYVRLVASHVSHLYDLSMEEVAAKTSHNATILFHI